MKLKTLSLLALGALATAAMSAQTPAKVAPPPGMVAFGGTKISGTMKCGKTSRTAVEVGDDAGHALAIGKTPCTWTQPLTLAGVQTKEGSTTAVSDVRGDVSADHGYHVGTMSNGDNYYVRFDGRTQTGNGSVQSQAGRWGFVGGTGKLKGLQGRGTFKSTGGSDGSTTVEVEGEYRLPNPEK